MDIEEAESVIQAWGKFLEVAYGQQLVLFRGNIPQSLLPFPKEKIEEALKVGATLHRDDGNEEGARVLEASRSNLIAFCEDQVAFSKIIQKES